MTVAFVNYIEGRPYIYSDTLLTQEDKKGQSIKLSKDDFFNVELKEELKTLKKSFLGEWNFHSDWGLKTIIISNNCAISWAGNIYYANLAMQEFFNLPDSCNTTTIHGILKKHSIDSGGGTDFIAHFSNLKNEGFDEDCMSVEITANTTNNFCQDFLGIGAGSAISLISKNITNEGYGIGRFIDVNILNTNAYPSVGGIGIGVILTKDGFQYQTSYSLQCDFPDQVMYPGENIVIFQNKENGGYQCNIRNIENKFLGSMLLVQQNNTCIVYAPRLFYNLGVRDGILLGQIFNNADLEKLIEYFEGIGPL